MLIGLIIYGLYQIWDALVLFINNCAKSFIDFSFLISTLVSKFISDIISVLVSVPWFVWVIIAIPMIVFGYSYVWYYHKNYPAKFERKLYSLKMVLTSTGCFLVLVLVALSIILLSILLCILWNLSIIAI